MAPKIDIIFFRGRFKSVAASRRMIGNFDDEHDLKMCPQASGPLYQLLEPLEAPSRRWRLA